MDAATIDWVVFKLKLLLLTSASPVFIYKKKIVEVVCKSYSQYFYYCRQMLPAYYVPHATQLGEVRYARKYRKRE